MSSVYFSLNNIFDGSSSLFARHWPLPAIIDIPPFSLNIKRNAIFLSKAGYLSKQ